MIKVTLFLREQDKIAGLTVQGHSGTAKRGEDIICAGVSALTETALLGLGEYLGRPLDYRVARGKLCLRLKEGPDDFSEAILQTMLLGLRQIEKQNPQALKISCKREVS